MVVSSRAPAPASRGRVLAIRKDFVAFGKPDFGAGEIDAVSRVLRSGWMGWGA